MGASPLFMVIRFSPDTQMEVWLSVLKNPKAGARSANNPALDRQPLTQAMRNRVISYLSELAMNIFIGNGAVYGLRGQPDVPPNIEVKWSRKGDRLIALPHELKPGLKFVLATGYPDIRFVGWCHSEEIKQPFRNHPRRAVFTTSENLRQFGSILGEGQSLSHP